MLSSGEIKFNFGSSQPIDPELWEGGVYPERGKDGGWVFQMDPVRRVVADYYSRTLQLSSGSPVDWVYDVERNKFFLISNEKRYAGVIAAIENKGGAYVGVGTHMNFTYASWMGADHAFFADINAMVPIIFTPLYGALLAMAPTRVQFLSMIGGYPLPETFPVDETESMSGTELFEYLNGSPLYLDARFRSAVYDGIIELLKTSSGADVLIHEKIDRWAEYLLLSLGHFFEVDEMFNMFARMDSEGRGGLLSSEAQYQRERELFLQGRVTGMVGSLEYHVFPSLNDVLTREGLKLGVAYLSNTENWHYKDDYGSGALGIYNYYSGLTGIPHDEDAAVVSAINLRDSMSMNLDAYVGLAIPLQVDVEEAAEIAARLFILRRLTLRNAGSSYEDFIYDLILYFRYTNESYHRLFAHAVEEYLRHGMPVSEFDEAMRRHSSDYNSLSEAEKELIIANLVYAGVLTRGAGEERRGEVYDDVTIGPGMSFGEPASMGIVDSQVLYWFGNNGGNGAKSGRPPLTKTWHMGSAPSLTNGSVFNGSVLVGH